MLPQAERMSRIQSRGAARGPPILQPTYTSATGFNYGLQTSFCICRWLITSSSNKVCAEAQKLLLTKENKSSTRRERGGVTTEEEMWGETEDMETTHEIWS